MVNDSDTNKKETKTEWCVVFGVLNTTILIHICIKYNYIVFDHIYYLFIIYL